MKRPGRSRFTPPRATRLALLPALVGTALLVALAATGCESTPGTGSSVYTIPIFGEYDYERPLEIKRGEALYLRHCSGCHGVEGDGKGPAAPWLNPKPRNFVEAKYKFSSTPAGKLPTDEDLLHTLNHGLKGTSMPEWRLIPEPDRRAIVAYIKSFSPRFADEGAGTPIPRPEDPYAADPIGGILDGEFVYHAIATCWNCHPAYTSEEMIRELYEGEGMPFQGTRSDLYHPIVTTTADGDLYPPDFAVDYIKTGTALDQLYYRIGAGITGTAMPTWSGVLTDADIWAMAHYVKYLADHHRVWPRTPAESAVMFGQRHPDGVEQLVAPAEGEDQ